MDIYVVGLSSRYITPKFASTLAASAPLYKYIEYIRARTTVTYCYVDVRNSFA